MFITIIFIIIIIIFIIIINIVVIISVSLEASLLKALGALMLLVLFLAAGALLFTIWEVNPQNYAI